MTKHIQNIIRAVRDEPSKNGKLAILQKHKDNTVLKDYLWMTYNKYLQYGIRTVPEHTPASTYSNASLPSVLKRFKKLLITGKYTGNKAKDLVKECVESIDPDQIELIELLLNRHLNAGISEKTINKVWPGLIPVYGVMKCEDYASDLLDENERILAQVKMDGCRATFMTTDSGHMVLSSSGRQFTLHDVFKNLRDKIKRSDVVIDGEFVVKDKKGNIMPRKKGNGICNKAIKGTITVEEASRIVFVVWDILTYDEFISTSQHGTEQRFNTLKAFLEGANLHNVKLVEHEYVNGIKNIQPVFEKFTKRGEEGIIVKKLDQRWEIGRSKGWLKMKIADDADIQVVEVLEGLGKNQNSMGALRCTDASGKLNVNIGTGFSDEERKWFWDNKEKVESEQPIIEVLYNEVDVKDGVQLTLYFARFVELRHDKHEPDNLNEVYAKKVK